MVLGAGVEAVCTHMRTHTHTRTRTRTWPHCSAGEPHNDRDIPASSCCAVGRVDQKEVTEGLDFLSHEMTGLSVLNIGKHLKEQFYYTIDLSPRLW